MSMEELSKTVKKWDKSLESFKGDRASLIDVVIRIAVAIEGMLKIMDESHQMKKKS
jgi:hypothetical protein